MQSSRKVNYSSRVAKNIERKMLRDALFRMSAFYPINTYKYIGFGAKYFTDYILFHKYLHIDKMFSIEGDVSNKNRYEFNKPLKCIEMKYGMSNEVLPEVEIDERSIIWLDYDGELSKISIEDVGIVCSKAGDVSVLIVSYNSRPRHETDLEKEYPNLKKTERIKRYLSDRVGEDYVPFDLDDRGLSNWTNYSKALRRCVINCLDHWMNINNRGEETKLKYKQFLNFNYKDNAEMSTLGFIFYSEGSESKIENCSLSDFDFCSFDENPYVIDVPNLTLKETKTLLEYFPLDELTPKLDRATFPPSDVKKFSKLYKYMPNFGDIEIF